MARQIRIEYEEAWYHITCRGNERREIFADDFDREKFLEILAASIDQYNAEVHAYVLMSNQRIEGLIRKYKKVKNLYQKVEKKVNSIN